MKYFLTLLIIVAASGCAPRPAQQEYITLGALLPLTGEDSDEGLRAINGLLFAKEEINSNGGVLGKKLDIIILNDRGDENYIVEQYQVLKEKGVAAIIGSSYSSVTMALAKAAEQDGLPIISPTASNPDVTKGRRNVFRAIFIDDYQAEAMAHFAYNALGARSALVLINKDQASFRGLVDFFIQSFEKRGGRIMAAELYSSGDDFADILKKYASNQPEVIFCPEDYIPAAHLVNAIFEAGFDNTYVLGSDAWDGLLAYIVSPEITSGVFYSAPFSFDDQDENVSQFVRNFFNVFSQMPMSGSATAYTCVYILSEAISKAGSTDKNAVISAIKGIELDAITGRIRFDENNNPSTNVYVIQITSSGYSTYEKISLY